MQRVLDLLVWWLLSTVGLHFCILCTKTSREKWCGLKALLGFCRPELSTATKPAMRLELHWPFCHGLCSPSCAAGCPCAGVWLGRGCAWPGDRAPGLPGWVLSSSGCPGSARGARQDLAAGGITGDSLVPTWQDSPGAAGGSGAAPLVQGPGLGGHQECGC